MPETIGLTRLLFRGKGLLVDSRSNFPQLLLGAAVSWRGRQFTLVTHLLLKACEVSLHGTDIATSTPNHNQAP
jgi:hypothetical protein